MMDVEAIVADDDDDSRTLLVAFLRRDGFEASEARNGNELVDRVQELRRERRDDALVVVSDIGMPECTGIQAARRLRRTSLTLPIILVTGSTNPHTWRAAAEAGVDAILQKPVEAHVLIRAVRHVIGV